MKDLFFKSKVFKTEILELTEKHKETIVQGGHELFPKLPEALDGIKQIGIIGYASQGRAQSVCWKKALEGTGIKTVVGLRKGSPSREKARADGFTEENGTLGEVYEVIANSDLVIFLIEDAAMASEYKDFFAVMKDGATMGVSHGFILGHLKSIGEYFPKNINVIGVCPKGMGDSVYRLHTQGTGIVCSFAVEQDLNGKATDYALGWAVALGAPWILATTLEMEYRSDLTGERGILLGAPDAIVKTLYRRFSKDLGMTEEVAFRYSVKHITDSMRRVISENGIIAVYHSLSLTDRKTFERIYSAAYQPALAILHEIYDEVESGNEIRSVIMANKRLKRFPMTKLAEAHMWKVVAGKVEAEGDEKLDSPFIIHPFTAGLYCAVMMAQIDLFIEKGHRLSEICNESVIEAVDSLLPYMDVKTIAHMADNCSMTARQGMRKWSPRFERAIEQAFIDFDNNMPVDQPLIDEFKNHMIHGALAVCATKRPPIDIAVTA